MKAAQWFHKNWWKLALSLGFDFLDFTMGRIPIFGSLLDILGAFLGFGLWGSIGLLQGAEVLDFTDQLDGFIPTLTIAGLIDLAITTKMR